MPSLEMAVQVLTTGYWPATPATDNLILPMELCSLRDKFSAFYTTKYQGRRLAFAHALERCVVSCRFPRGKKDLEVSLFQAIVLMCFNKADQLSYSAVRDRTGLDEEELKRTLLSLACGVVGTRVLTKVDS
jgi:cullin-4